MAKPETSRFWRLSIKMIAIIIIAEIFIMLLFASLPLSSLSEVQPAIADALLLGVIVTPVFYFLLILPLRKEVFDEQEDRLLLHDSLTGLPHAPLFQEMLEHELHEAARDLNCVSLVLIDPGGIGDINQEMGFDAGDSVLVHIADSIQKVCRTSDIFAHLGESVVGRMKGDVFAVLAPHVDISSSSVIERKVRQVVDEPFDVDGMAIDVIATTGVATYPEHGLNARDLLKHANAALTMAKQDGLASVTYKEVTNSPSLHRIEVVSRLRHAIASKQLELFYQPKVDLSTDRVSSAEALIRWMGEGGLSPAEFIPIAEQTGLISEITTWVVNEAVRQCKAWDRMGIKINVAVNVSARNLYDSELTEIFVQACRTQKLEPSRITVEVTEGSAMAHPELAIQRLSMLRDAGFRISLDDFGTGYSSLSYLKHIPAHELKLDQSFVATICKDSRDERLVSSVIDLAHDLNLTTVAEGVEDEGVMLTLKRLGCDKVQGYFYSRPLEVAAFEQWFQDREGS